MFSYMKDVGMGLVFAINAALGYGLILTLALGYLGAWLFLGTWPLVAILAYFVGFAWNDPAKRRTA